MPNPNQTIYPTVPEEENNQTLMVMVELVRLIAKQSAREWVAEIKGEASAGATTPAVPLNGE